MTKEFIERVKYEDLEKAYYAYNQLMLVYEYTCGGPYKAKEYREYFAIVDSRDRIRAEVFKRANQQSHGDGQ